MLSPEEQLLSLSFVSYAQIIARLRAIRPTSVVPTDPLVAALAAAEGKSIEDLIDLFTQAAAL